jgi:hypothetical protein
VKVDDQYGWSGCRSFLLSCPCLTVLIFPSALGQWYVGSWLDQPSMSDREKVVLTLSP